MKNILITGAGKGIGFESVKNCITEGAIVYALIKDKRDKWFANYAATHYNLKDLNTGYYFGKVKNLI